jgi:probable rRNA maturation factor
VSVEVLNESGVEVDEEALVSLARHVMDSMEIHPLAELSLLLVDKAAMTELHEKWMDEAGPTDVLAFPMDELRPAQPPGTAGEGAADPSLLGDVVLCPAVAKAQARQAGHGMGEELRLLCTHGILHLLGYDHAEPEEHKEMFELQARLLTAWQEKREAQ